MRKKNAVAIVGGGLSGLFLARLLSKQGIDFVLLEAQPRLGGRIRSIQPSMPDSSQAAGRYDVGPTWFWPEMQPVLRNLVEELGIDVFPQYASGDMLIEQAPGHSLLRFPTYQMSPASMRMAGGLQTLVDAMVERLPKERLRTGVAVKHLKRSAQGVSLQGADLEGNELALEADKVVIAMPPRLIASSLGFAPQLPTSTLTLWAKTPTWMAGHAKIVVVYDAPFWRTAGLSGSAQSRVGPLGEIHDASDMTGNPALFGFFGIDASRRQAAGQEALAEAAIEQLVRLFGDRARSPKSVMFQDWAAEPYVATDRDQAFLAHHPAYGQVGDLGDAWRDRLMLAGTEAAQQGGGYLEGAVVAAATAADWCEGTNPWRDTLPLAGSQIS